MEQIIYWASRNDYETELVNCNGGEQPVPTKKTTELLDIEEGTVLAIY